MAAEWHVHPEFVESGATAGGVRSAYAEPAKLGVDRWMAMIGARTMDPRTACVVSIGTAMTIDGLDGAGRHLGGVIVPGPDLMVGSLLRNTSEIARRAEQGSVGAKLLADNTLGAITQGATHALAALSARCRQLRGTSASNRRFSSPGARQRASKRVSRFRSGACQTWCCAE